MSVILKLVTANPNYPGLNEFSTVTNDFVLSDDPMYKIGDIISVKHSATLTINYYVNNKKYNVSVENDPTNTSTTIYNMSAFGVIQPDGTSYGND